MPSHSYTPDAESDVRRDDRPKSDTGDTVAKPPKCECGGHGEIVEQHRYAQSPGSIAF